MSLINAFWRSFDTSGNTIDEFFSEFAQDLSKEDVDAVRTDVVASLIEYFARMATEIQEAQEAEGSNISPIRKIFDYFADACFQLDEDTKELLRKSILASAEEYDDEDEDEDEDDDDDEYQVKKFLKALARTTPGPDKDYIALDQDTDEDSPVHTATVIQVGLRSLIVVPTVMVTGRMKAPTL